MLQTGVLLLGFGGPDKFEAVQPFMCNLMGREPSEELVARVCRRYLTIGGVSPLPTIAKDMAEGIESRLSQAGHEIPVRVGMRYWDPYIKDALAELRSLGCERVITLSLSPFESKAASGAYREAVAQAVADSGDIEIVEAPLAATMHEFISYMADSTVSSLEELEAKTGAVVLFTAHSLPATDCTIDDPYVSGLRTAAQDIAEAAGFAPGDVDAGSDLLGGITAFGTTLPPQPWFLAFQSKGERACDWLGPDLEDVIAALPEDTVASVVVSPIGFMTDHLETMYDLDVITAEQVLDKGMQFRRAYVANDQPLVLDGLARLVTDLL